MAVVGFELDEVFLPFYISLKWLRADENRLRLNLMFDSAKRLYPTHTIPPKRNKSFGVKFFISQPIRKLRKSPMPNKSTGQVFISYSRKDYPVMLRIVAFLRKRGINAWLDNEKLSPGTPIWEEEIEKAIKNSSAIIVVLSPDSKNSEWVRREISLADQYRKRVYPVLANGDEESSISLRLINRQFVDIRNNEEIGLRSLETALSAYMQDLNDEEEKVKDQVSLGNDKAIGQQIIAGEISHLGVDNTTAINTASQRILWATLGWAIAGLIGGYTYSEYDAIAGGAVGGLIGGAIGGGLTTSIALQIKNTASDRKNMIRNILAWAFAGAMGWSIGWGLLSDASGAGIGMAVFAILGLAITLGMDYILSNWKSIVVITLAWAIGGAIGWSIARNGLIDELGMDKALSWGIGTAIGWAIGGSIMSWQLTRK